MLDADAWIDRLGLHPHPEGGYYKETYRSPGVLGASAFWPGVDGPRNWSTGIYFLLKKGQRSHFHRIRSDEMWHFYEGHALCIHVIQPDGTYSRIRLGRPESDPTLEFQAVVPAGAWFASEVEKEGAYSLVGCTVAPGFDFQDFELAKRQDFALQFPQHAAWTADLCLP